MVTLDEVTAKMDIAQCSFCSKTSKYTCPRCNAKYCSLSCYKDSRHLQCSEEFYKEQVLSDVAAMEPNQKPQKEMLDKLNRSSAFGDDLQINYEDEDDADDLTWIERFGDIDFETVDEDDLWHRLTKKEQEEFCSLHDRDESETLLSVWQPWWLQELSHLDEDDKMIKLPNVVRVSRLPSLQGLKLSPTIPFDILNVLCTYVLICRAFNGDHHKLATRATQLVLKISENLRGNKSFEDSKSALESSLEAAKPDALYVEPSKITEDIARIVQSHEQKFNESYTSRALSDVYRLFGGAKMSKLMDDEQEALVRKCQKKILFMLSWVKAFGPSLKEIVSSLGQTKEASD